MKLELASLKVCPYVQRSVIVLKYKKVPFITTYIDPASPPPWFKELSPTGKVPLLRVDDQEVLFESFVINEYIDEVTPHRLHPEDPLARAKHRAWIEHCSDYLGAMFLIVTGPEEKYNSARKVLLERLERLETVVGFGPFFGGKRLSLVDAAYAPLLMRLAFVSEIHPVVPWEKYPKVAAWRDSLLELVEVKESVPPDFDEVYTRMIAKKSGYLSGFLP